MTTGVVQSVTPEWAGDTLTAATTTTTRVLLVGDAGDFEEEFDKPRYLVIGDDLTPRRYVAVANDETAQQSVTLAADAGGVFEAGLPVVLWDPTSASAEKRAIEYRAWVLLDDQGKPIPATIPHEKIPLAGAYSLEGASVRLVERDHGEWIVADVLGREALIDSTTVQTGPTGKRVVLLAGSSPAMLLYTADVAEVSPGQVSNTLVEVGAFKSLITQVVSPKISGATNQATLSLQSTNDNGVISRHATLAADKLVLNGDRVESPNLYLTAPSTTAATANVNIGPAGQLRESTSSRRFKQDIEPAGVDVAAWLRVRGATFRDRNEVAADPDTERRYVGFIAEELHDLGLSEYVTYDEESRPHAVQYERLTVPLLEIVKRQDSRLRALEEALSGLLTNRREGA